MNMRVLSTLFSRQFLIFVAGGFLSALIDIGVMVLLLHIGINTLTAASCGFALGLAVNFFFHARVTFTARKTLRSAIRFIIIVFLNYGCTLALVFIAQSLDMSPVTGKIASLPLVAVNGFLISKYWVFR